ncbi:contact-dependent growth inhibition system immunity protein [Streptomyces viridosporus]|uniref:contact-dependent growth inhibition system immunity protein n=1 Tax=Streptomyces viridosporus TaxID=67581 RepID=UPI003F4D182D
MTPHLSEAPSAMPSRNRSATYPDRETAQWATYRASTDPQLVARLVGELHELLALDLDESDYALAVAELGMEVDPPAPYAPSGWLAHLADRLARSSAEYGPSSRAGQE